MTADCSEKKKKIYQLEGEKEVEFPRDKEVNGVCHIFINNFVASCTPVAFDTSLRGIYRRVGD